MLKSFYHNSKTSRYLNTENTSHGQRTPKGNLGISPTNLVITKGESTQQEMYTDTVIEVLSMQGLHSGTDPISGDFSVAISGYLKKDGKVIQAIRGTTLSGNFYQLLNQIDLLGKELHSNTSGDFFAPLIRFGNLSVSGV